MFEERAVTTTHVTNAKRLLIDGTIEKVDNDPVGLLEVVVVGSAAAPNVHAAIDEELASGFVDSWNAGIAEQECGQDIEHRQIGDSDSIGSGDPDGVAAGPSQGDQALTASGPTEQLEQVKDAGEAAGVAGQAVGINAVGRIFKDPKHTLACKRHHCRPGKHTVQVAHYLP